MKVLVYRKCSTCMKALKWLDEHIHGRELREADRDEEGKQTMRVLARNMTFLMKSIELGKKQFGLPEKEEHAFTHFIR